MELFWLTVDKYTVTIAHVTQHCIRNYRMNVNCDLIRMCKETVFCIQVQ
jgi:hypothetical protein